MNERLPIMKEESVDEFDQIIKSYREKMSQRTDTEVTKKKVNTKIRSKLRNVIPEISPPKRGNFQNSQSALCIQGNTVVPESLTYVKPMKAEISIYSQKQKDYGTLPIEPYTAQRSLYNPYSRAQSSVEKNRKINLDARVNRKFIQNRKRDLIMLDEERRRLDMIKSGVPQWAQIGFVTTEDNKPRDTKIRSKYATVLNLLK